MSTNNKVAPWLNPVKTGSERLTAAIAHIEKMEKEAEVIANTLPGKSTSGFLVSGPRNADGVEALIAFRQADVELILTAMRESKLDGGDGDDYTSTKVIVSIRVDPAAISDVFDPAPKK